MAEVPVHSILEYKYVSNEMGEEFILAKECNFAPILL